MYRSRDRHEDATGADARSGSQPAELDLPDNPRGGMKRKTVVLLAVGLSTGLIAALAALLLIVSPAFFD